MIFALDLELMGEVGEKKEVKGKRQKNERRYIDGDDGKLIMLAVLRTTKPSESWQQIMRQMRFF